MNKLLSLLISFALLFTQLSPLAYAQVNFNKMAMGLEQEAWKDPANIKEFAIFLENQDADYVREYQKEILAGVFVARAEAQLLLRDDKKSAAEKLLVAKDKVLDIVSEKIGYELGSEKLVYDEETKRWKLVSATKPSVLDVAVQEPFGGKNFYYEYKPSIEQIESITSVYQMSKLVNGVIALFLDPQGRGFEEPAFIPLLLARYAELLRNHYPHEPNKGIAELKELIDKPFNGSDAELVLFVKYSVAYQLRYGEEQFFWNAMNESEKGGINNLIRRYGEYYLAKHKLAKIIAPAKADELYNAYLRVTDPEHAEARFKEYKKSIYNFFGEKDGEEIEYLPGAYDRNAIRDFGKKIIEYIKKNPTDIIIGKTSVAHEKQSGSFLIWVLSASMALHSPSTEALFGGGSVTVEQIISEIGSKDVAKLSGQMYSRFAQQMISSGAAGAVDGGAAGAGAEAVDAIATGTRVIQAAEVSEAAVAAESSAFLSEAIGAAGVIGVEALAIGWIGAAFVWANGGFWNGAPDILKVKAWIRDAEWNERFNASLEQSDWGQKSDASKIAQDNEGKVAVQGKSQNKLPQQAKPQQQAKSQQPQDAMKGQKDLSREAQHQKDQKQQKQQQGQNKPQTKKNMPNVFAGDQLRDSINRQVIKEQHQQKNKQPYQKEEEQKKRDDPKRRRCKDEANERETCKFIGTGSGTMTLHELDNFINNSEEESRRQKWELLRCFKAVGICQGYLRKDADDKGNAYPEFDNVEEEWTRLSNNKKGTLRKSTTFDTYCGAGAQEPLDIVLETVRYNLSTSPLAQNACMGKEKQLEELAEAVKNKGSFVSNKDRRPITHVRVVYRGNSWLAYPEIGIQGKRAEMYRVFAQFTIDNFNLRDLVDDLINDLGKVLTGNYQGGDITIRRGGHEKRVYECVRDAVSGKFERPRDAEVNNESELGPRECVHFHYEEKKKEHGFTYMCNHAIYYRPNDLRNFVREYPGCKK